MWMSLYGQGKCWDNHPQEKAFNKENTARIQGHWKIRYIIMKYWLVGKCNNMKENYYVCIFVAESYKCRMWFNLGEHSKLMCRMEGGSGCLVVLVFGVHLQLFGFFIFLGSEEHVVSQGEGCWFASFLSPHYSHQLPNWLHRSCF